jgi:hypothetical protein
VERLEKGMELDGNASTDRRSGNSAGRASKEVSSILTMDGFLRLSVECSVI